MLLELILYYIYPDTITISETKAQDPIYLDMMNGTLGLPMIETQTTFEPSFLTINGTNIVESNICACNGSIYIIDDLLWAFDSDENIMSINEYDSDKELIKVIDINGRETISKGLHIEIYSDGSAKKVFLNE